MWFSSMFKKINLSDGFRKRGLFYIAIAIIGIGYELFVAHPIRPIVLLLWLAVIGIGITVILTLKDEKR